MAVLRVTYVLAACFLTLCIVIIARTIQFSFSKAAAKPCQSTDDDYIHADSKVLGRFSQAIRYQTVSWDIGHYNRKELLRFQQFLIKEFSSVFNHPLVQYEVISNYSLLLYIKGSDSTLQPYMISSHMDVVPASNASWDVPPFEGRIKDGYIWGRGTLDMKNGLMASFESIQFLLNRGHTPKRGFYIACGHDEEVYGKYGAKEIASVLTSRNVQLEFIIDEGTVIVRDVFPGVNTPYALVGVAEKGYVVLELSVTTEGGHSSMPPKQTCIGILAQAISRLESCPMPPIWDPDGPVHAMFEQIAPKVFLPVRVIVANLWLFNSIFKRVLSYKPSTNALLCTTTAVTRFDAGIKDNVIAAYAKATVNHRIHPKNTLDEIIEHDRRCINDDRVMISVKSESHTPPSPLSPWDQNAFGFQVISESILQVFPDAGVVPGLMVAGTDTKHYQNLSKSIYRFLPSVLYPGDIARIHGVNERISVKNYEQTINFFHHLILNADKMPYEATPKLEL